MAEKTLTEATARKFHENYERLAPQYKLDKIGAVKDWDNLPVNNKGLMLATAGEVLDWLGILGLHVQLREDQVYVFTSKPAVIVQEKPTLLPPPVLKEVPPPPTAKTPAASASEKYESARLKGYTGDSCGECGGMRMVRNGSCQKCEDCGSTSGCS